MIDTPANSPSAEPRVTLVLGGTRSGKSSYAERLVTDYCARTGNRAVYLATAQARDGEMAERIALHRARRGQSWRTVEAPTDIVTPLSNEPTGTGILVDCLTLWLSNLMEAERNLDQEFERLTSCLSTITGPVVFVANEVGLGIVPDNKIARRFRDHAGTLNQAVAALADRVLFVAAGLPMRLK
jgi:adenosylcobinamide kinase / adenosylcobinamide-phosphate guanylyltransferase